MIMKKLIYTILIAVFFTSCKTNVSEKGIERVVEYCRCEVESFSGIANSEDGNSIDFIELTLSGNAETLMGSQMIASAIASEYFLYHQNEGKDDFDRLDITIDLTDVNPTYLMSFSYSKEDILIMMEKHKELKKDLNFIKNKDFHGFHKAMEHEVLTYEQQELQNIFLSMDSAYGYMIDYYVDSWGYFKTDSVLDSPNVINFYGEIVRETKNHNFSFTYYRKNELRSFYFE